MTWVDYAAFTVLGVSFALGLWRGFVREIFSLAGWVAAVAAAILWSSSAAAAIPASIGSPAARTVGAFVLIFLLVLLASAFAGMLLARLLRAAGLGVADRLLGAGFGIARGALILVAAALVAGLTPLARSAEWRHAAISEPLETAVIALKPWLPAGLAERIEYRRFGNGK